MVWSLEGVVARSILLPRPRKPVPPTQYSFSLFSRYVKEQIFLLHLLKENDLRLFSLNSFSMFSHFSYACILAYTKNLSSILGILKGAFWRLIINVSALIIAVFLLFLELLFLVFPFSAFRLVFLSVFQSFSPALLLQRQEPQVFLF